MAEKIGAADLAARWLKVAVDQFSAGDYQAAHAAAAISTAVATAQLSGHVSAYGSLRVEQLAELTRRAAMPVVDARLEALGRP